MNGQSVEDMMQTLVIRYLVPADEARRLLILAQDGKPRTYENRVSVRCIYSNGQSSRYILR